MSSSINLKICQLIWCLQNHVSALICVFIPSPLFALYDMPWHMQHVQNGKITAVHNNNTDSCEQVVNQKDVSLAGKGPNDVDERI